MAPEGIIPNPKKRLLDQVREFMRTEQTYIDWKQNQIVVPRARGPRIG
jgi:hypothetical protein